MNYEVSEKQGESIRIGLRELEEGIYEVTLDDAVVHVDAARSSRTVYSIIEDGKQFEAIVDEKGAHDFDVTVAGRLFHMEALDERTKLLSGAAASVAAGPQNVEAEMPGKVVKVNCGVGAEVAQDEGVLVIEAMKMENEIKSPIAGIVTEIEVSEGDTVEAGTPLFTVEPPAEAGS
ncbi:MAG: biotin/lipoyl-binding protein [Deltaproteobacteria bacterium]|nr:biotin/lipoyl-binding protein [Deltaproteobacteria bacterium]MBW2361971.1 biotin/lipoyl-binding protein [Deltaproteobacteria bacterium]